MTEAQRIERARRAQMALEEFLDPAFDLVIATYTARIEELASSQPWEAAKITALANAARIARSVKAQIENIVDDGELAKERRNHAQEIEKLSPAKRRFLNIAPF